MHANHTPPPPILPAEPVAATAPRVLRVPSQALLAGRHEVEIDHNGVIYRLRQTGLGKLILTK
jgi:hemin uptake protein HemP